MYTHEWLNSNIFIKFSMNFPSVQTFEGFLIPMLTTAYHMNLRFLTTEVRGGRKKGGNWKSCLKTGNIIPSWKRNRVKTRWEFKLEENAARRINKTDNEVISSVFVRCWMSTVLYLSSLLRVPRSEIPILSLTPAVFYCCKFCAIIVKHAA